MKKIQDHLKKERKPTWMAAYQGGSRTRHQHEDIDISIEIRELRNVKFSNTEYIPTKS